MAQIKEYKRGAILYELKNAELKETLVNAVEDKIYLARASLSLADFAFSNLSRASLSAAEFIGTDLTSAYLKEADLTKVNFSEANLTNARLDGANLKGANLIRANLTGANLMGANLCDANLSYANLSYAKLSKADLQSALLHCTSFEKAILNKTYFNRAKFTEAYLKGANLFGANLTKAKFKNTNFDETIFNETIFGLTNLDECLNLEKAIVSGKCIIDFETLQNSPNLPHAFLHKLGISELALDYVHDLTNESSIKMFPVFLSHSTNNKKFAKKLYESLNEKGVHCWFDEKKMRPGDDIFEEINKGINEYDKTILVCSKESLGSWWVNEELERILEKERCYSKEKGKNMGLLIPITIDDYIYNWKNAKAQTIRWSIIGDFRNWQDEVFFEKSLRNLIHSLLVDRPNVPPISFI